MNVSQIVQDSCLTLLSDISAMTPELRDLQGLAMAEMERGSERNLKPLMDELIALSARGYKISERFQKDTIATFEGEQFDEAFGLASKLIEVMSGGDQGFLKEVRPELAAAILENLKTKEEMEGAMNAKFGEGALMRMLAEDGLMPDFLEGMDKAIHPERKLDRENIEAYAKSISEHVLEGVRKDLN